MTTNSAQSASLRSLRLRRLLAGAGVLAFAAVAFTGSPAWGEPRQPREKIVFGSNCGPQCPFDDLVRKGEIYMMNPDGSKATRLTNNDFSEGFPMLSPDGKGKIVFDGNKISLPNNRPLDSDLFLLNPAAAAAGVPTPPLPLTRGSSASFDPTGKYIAFHRSASLAEGQGIPIPGTTYVVGGGGYGNRFGRGVGTPPRTGPGDPTIDSDIFVLNLDDGGEPVNLTNGLTTTPGVRGEYASDDADWSPDGKWIAFTSRIPPPKPDTPFPEQNLGIYVMNLEHPDKPITKLTNLNGDDTETEERSPAWSPDSTRIAIMRRAEPRTPIQPFKIWVLDFDPGTPEDPPHVTQETQLTPNAGGHLAPAWIPGAANRKEAIMFQVNRPNQVGDNQIYVVNADGSKRQCVDDKGNITDAIECPLTGPNSPAGPLQGGSGSPKFGIIAVGRDPQ